MANKTDVQYIRFYTDGSAARKIEPEPPKKRAFRPIRRPRTKLVVHVDLLAGVTIAVAAVMLVLMLVGLVNMRHAQAEQARMEQYVQTLKSKNSELRQTYESGFDLEEVAQKAEELGMIPAQEAEHIPIRVEVPVKPEAEPTLWQRICTFLRDLFA